MFVLESTSMEFDAENEEAARKMVEKACKELLANQVMEYFEFDLHQVEPA